MEKVNNIIKKEFDSKPIKTKIKSYNGKTYTTFQNNKIPKEGSPCICLSVILIDSVYKKDKNHYPEVFLEECKYAKILFFRLCKFSPDLGLKCVGFYSRKYKESFLLKRYEKSFLLRRYKNFFSNRAGKLHFWEYKEFIFWCEFFLFLLGLGLEVR